MCFDNQAVLYMFLKGMCIAYPVTTHTEKDDIC